MAINFSESYVKTYLDYIDKKAISFFEDKKSIGVNNLINLKDEEDNYLSYLKYAYIYIGALYHNIIYSAHYKTLANAESPINTIKLFFSDYNTFKQDIYKKFNIQISKNTNIPADNFRKLEI